MRTSRALRMFAKTILTDDKNSWEFDAGWATEAIIWLEVEDTDGTNMTLATKVQISLDRANWYDEGTAFGSITADGWYMLKISAFGHFIRLNFILGGTDPSFTVTAWFVGKT